MENKEKTDLNNFVGLNISEQDIGLLAMMCAKCYPFVYKKNIFSKKYAYYFPKYKSDLILAKDIFDKNGINMQFYKSRMCNVLGEDILRVECDGSLKDDFIKSVMHRISCKHIELYNMYNEKIKKERKELNQQILVLRKARDDKSR